MTLAVKANPSDSFVLLDGTVLGRASEFDPAAGGAPITLPGPGEYELKLRKAGLEDYRIKVAASRSGKRGDVAARLKTTPATELEIGDLERIRVEEAIGFDVTPDSAEVFVDGRKLGRVSDFPGRRGRRTTWLELPNGLHRISLRAAGFERRDYAVDVGSSASEKRFRIEVNLQRSP